MPDPALAKLFEEPPAPSPQLHLVAEAPAPAASAPTAPAPAAPAPTAPAPTAPAPAAPALMPRLEVPIYDFAAARLLERELAIGHVLAQILVRRGFTEPAAARGFLDARETHEPAAFAGIERATGLIEHHIGRGSRIVVHGDYDVDGVCATAIMVRALRSLGANVGWFLPSRLEDGYGLTIRNVDRMAERGAALVITVDCAITAVEEVGHAAAAGLDVVVTDHHTPRNDGALPDAPIVHPRLCGYPCPDLCGTGVAFKLAQALGAPTADEDLELVALATVADLMPLRGENRTLVRSGLRAMANTARPGLRALMTVARADPSALDAGALGFRLAPRINAAGRLQRPDAGLELLLTEDQERAAEIAAELDRVNAERRAVEQRIAWEAEAQVAELGDRSAYVLASEGWHPGVIGIVASRIVERHHRPAILVALSGDEPGRGSGRSIPGFDLLGALHASASVLLGYGGHRAAAGLTVERDRMDEFRAAIERHADEVLTDELRQPVERVDAIVSGAELGLTLAEELARLEPCGMGNGAPRLMIPGARFDSQRAIGEGRHASFSVRSGGARARAVAFGCDGRVPGGLDRPVDATFKLERDEWRGVVEPRLVLRHAEACSPETIAILGEPDRYLPEALREVDAPLPAGPTAAGGCPGGRTVLDRRGESPLGVVADALATGDPVLAVCADVPRRLAGLSDRVGGFSLTSYHALDRDAGLSATFSHLIALDPPAGPWAEATVHAGSGFTHLAWGQAELRFAEQMHELEYGLRASLVAFYRSLRLRKRAAGEELERLLRGDGQHGRPARLAGRLIRVLAELELVSLNRDLPALAVAGTAPTALEHSAAYRAYTTRYEDGLRYLSSANLPPGA